MDSNIVERWKQIPAPYGLFEASNLGRIRRLCDGFVMSPGKSADGYCRIPLRLITGGKRTVYVHRMVALTWCAKDTVRVTVNHRNMLKADNRAENLEWVTFSENHRKAWEMQPERRAAASAKLGKRIVATDATGAETTFASGKLAAIAMGGSNKAGNISHAIASGGPAYGHHWRMAD